MLGIISSLDFFAPGISILLVEPLWVHTTSQNDHIRLLKDCIWTRIGFWKYWKPKRQQLFLWAMNIDVPKITHCPCMSLCSMPIALWHIFWNPKLFQTYTQLSLNSWIGGKQAGKKPIPVQMQSFDSRFRTSWLGVCPCKGSPQKNPEKRNKPK